MSKKPPQSKDKHGQGHDKKKKGAPQMSQNDLAKQEYLELDEEELEHRRQLDLKYRDRAKERREGIEEEEEVEEIDGERVIVREGDQELITTVKGLDFNLLRKEKEKEMRESTQNSIASLEKMLAERQIGTKKVDNVTNGKKEIKAVAKTSFGMSIHRALFQEPKKQGQRNIFKSNNCYDFDVNPDFGSTLPKLVIRGRDTNQQNEKPITMQIEDKIIGKISNIVAYIKSGKKPDAKRAFSEIQKEKTEKAKPGNNGAISEEEDSDEDSIFPEAKKLIKTEQGGKPAFNENKGLFFEETKEEKDHRALKGFFNSIKINKEEPMEIEKPQDTLAAETERIREKNKQYMEQVAQKRAEEKLAQLQEKDKDYYMECFPTDIPKLEDLKNTQKDLAKNKGKTKSKKRELNRQFDKVTKIMDEKRKGGGGGGRGDE